MEIEFSGVNAFISDNSVYMKNAFREVMKPLLVNAAHVTCWAHIMSLLGDEWRKYFTTVDRFVTKMKSIFVFSSQRKNIYSTFMENRGVQEPKMSLQPMLTRWNSWLLAVQQHDEIFRSLPIADRQTD